MANEQGDEAAQLLVDMLAWFESEQGPLHDRWKDGTLHLTSHDDPSYENLFDEEHEANWSFERSLAFLADAPPEFFVDGHPPEYGARAMYRRLRRHVEAYA